MRLTVGRYAVQLTGDQNAAVVYLQSQATVMMDSLWKINVVRSYAV